MTVVPLFCATFIRIEHKKEGEEQPRKVFFTRLVERFNQYFQRLLERYEALAKRLLVRPGFTAAVILGVVALVIVVLFPFLGRAYFPRTDPGQFVIDVRMPSGTRLEVSDQYIARVKQIIRETIKPDDLGIIPTRRSTSSPTTPPAT